MIMAGTQELPSAQQVRILQAQSADAERRKAQGSPPPLPASSTSEATSPAGQGREPPRPEEVLASDIEARRDELLEAASGALQQAIKDGSSQVVVRTDVPQVGWQETVVTNAALLAKAELEGRGYSVEFLMNRHVRWGPAQGEEDGPVAMHPEVSATLNVTW
jgi:hypothetical protein